MTIASLLLLSIHDYHLCLDLETMTGQINEAPSSMRQCFNDFSASCHTSKFHSKSSVIVEMTDEGCMHAGHYPSQLHTSKQYELVPVSAYSVPVQQGSRPSLSSKKQLYYLLFLDIFCHAKILQPQPDVGRPAMRGIPRSNRGLCFRAQPTRAVTP